MNGAAHDLEQRVFAGVAIDHGLEVFLDRQREVGRCGNGLFNGAGLAWLGRRRVGIAAKEKGEQRQRAALFLCIAQGADFFEVELDEGLFGGDLVGIVHAPEAAVGQKTIAHAQGAEVVLQLVVRVLVAVGLAGVEFLVPCLGLADGGHQGVVATGDECVFVFGLQQQAVIGLGELALNGEAGLVHLGPAELGQQGRDEFFFELGFVAGGQRGGVEVAGEPRVQVAEQRPGGQFVGLLHHEAVVEQRVGQPVLREKVLFHGVRRVK